MFHDVTLYNLVDIYLYFKISYCLCCEETFVHFYRLEGVIPQKKVPCIVSTLMSRIRNYFR